LRRNMPRFAPEVYAENLKLLTEYRQVADEVGCTPAQLALAWLLHQGSEVIPIPGTAKVEHVIDNAAANGIQLDNATIAKLNSLINQQTVKGKRYNEQSESEVDTEAFV